jgi:hypothetical protein
MEINELTVIIIAGSWRESPCGEVTAASAIDNLFSDCGCWEMWLTWHLWSQWCFWAIQARLPIHFIYSFPRVSTTRPSRFISGRFFRIITELDLGRTSICGTESLMECRRLISISWHQAEPDLAQFATWTAG